MGYREECEKLFVENIELKEKLKEARKLIDQLWIETKEQQIILDKIKRIFENA